jgi:nucleoid-associated protein YgaU
MNVAAAGMATSLVPAFIQATTMPLPPILFAYNPNGYETKGEAHIQSSGQPATGASQPQYLGIKAQELNVEIKMHAFSVPPVPPQATIMILNQLLLPNPLMPLTPTAPEVMFQWGPNIIMPRAHVTKVVVKHERFLLGIPIEATATVTLQAIPPPAPMPGTNPTSGGLATRRTYTMVAGDTLASVAHREYRNAGKWRALAIANGIDDPMRLKAGTVLDVPDRRTAEALS